MTPFTDILAWANTQPLWQQDALRTILRTNARIPTGEIRRLADLCLSGSTDIAPLTSNDLPLAGSAPEAATLRGFGHPQNVNALASDQWVPVGPQLTVVFGNNATGKTGYARILKKAFRARVVDELLPNVRLDTPGNGVPAATFEFRQPSGKSARVTWRSDAPLSSEVASRFAVLDAKSGHAYIVNNELQLAPQGLDVLPRLVAALDDVRNELSSRRSALSTARTFLEGVPPNTAAAATASRITATTELSDVLPALEFTEQHAARLEAARDGLAQLRSPRQVVAQLETARGAAKSIQAALEARQAITSAKAIQELADQRADGAAALEAAKKVESLSADQKWVKAVGSDPWIALIGAAAAFVAENDGEQLAIKQRCPLCLEKLSDAAEARLERFWNAVNDEASAQRASAERAVSTRMGRLAELENETGERLEALLSVVTPHAPLLGMSVTAAIASTSSTARQLRLKKATKGVDVTAAVNEVAAFVAEAGERISTLQKAGAGVASEVQRLNAEIQELEAKKTLSARSKQIQEHVGALRSAVIVDTAIASIRSVAATHLSTELNGRYVTDSYRTGVATELERLGFSRPVPVLTPQGSKGKVKILTLANAKLKTIAADQVFSEGEQTVIAIASFLSELGLTAEPVGLVFDDPISALDHRTREKVAARLVDEASRRQVIVFTHDVTFRDELTRFAKDAAVSVVASELESSSSAVGLVRT